MACYGTFVFRIQLFYLLRWGCFYWIYFHQQAIHGAVLAFDWQWIGVVPACIYRKINTQPPPLQVSYSLYLETSLELIVLYIKQGSLILFSYGPVRKIKWSPVISERPSYNHMIYDRNQKQHLQTNSTQVSGRCDFTKSRNQQKSVIITKQYRSLWRVYLCLPMQLCGCFYAREVNVYACNYSQLVICFQSSLWWLILRSL